MGRGMDFDIDQLDRVDPGSDKAEQALGKYRDALIARFIDSPEGRARVDSEIEPQFKSFRYGEIFFHDGSFSRL